MSIYRRSCIHNLEIRIEKNVSIQDSKWELCLVIHTTPLPLGTLCGPPHHRKQPRRRQNNRSQAARCPFWNPSKTEIVPHPPPPTSPTEEEVRHSPTRAQRWPPHFMDNKNTYIPLLLNSRSSLTAGEVQGLWTVVADPAGWGHCLACHCWAKGDC